MAAATDPAVNYLLSSFEGTINPVYTRGLNIYFRETKEKDKETYN